MADTGPDAQELVERAQLSQMVRDQLNRIGRLKRSPLARDVLQSRLMQDPQDRDTLDEIGNRHGLSRERARQVDKQLRAELAQKLQVA